MKICILCPIQLTEPLHIALSIETGDNFAGCGECRKTATAVKVVSNRHKNATIINSHGRNSQDGDIVLTRYFIAELESRAGTQDDEF